MWPKKLSVSVAVPPAPVRVPSQRPLAPSVASVTSVTNDKGDNEMILGLCTEEIFSNPEFFFFPPRRNIFRPRRNFSVYRIFPNPEEFF